MRGAIRDIPDGVYAAETLIDGYLDDPDPARHDLKIAVAVKVSGDELTVDLTGNLTGTSPQVSDRPINMPLRVRSTSRSG
jgi:N-methylhydantoinase B